MSLIQTDDTVKTTYEWLSNLSIENRPKNNYRKTSIICTIGPSRCAHAGPADSCRPQDQLG